MRRLRKIIGLDEIDYKILAAVGELENGTMSDLVVNLNISRPIIYNHVERLVREGFLIDKKERGFPPTRRVNLTPKGETTLLRKIEMETQLVEIEYPLDDLEKNVERRLYLFGESLSIQSERVYWASVATILSTIDPMKSFLALGDMEKEYLQFLAKLFVHSPKKLLDKTEGLTFDELSMAWRLVRQDGWREVDKREGFLFDYPQTWSEFYDKLSRELKDKMEERSLSRERIFMKLRAFSCPMLLRQEVFNY